MKLIRVLVLAPAALVVLGLGYAIGATLDHHGLLPHPSVFEAAATTAIGQGKSQDRLNPDFLQTDLIEKEFNLIGACETPTGACVDMDQTLLESKVPQADFSTLMWLGYPVAVV